MMTLFLFHFDGHCVNKTIIFFYKTKLGFYISEGII